MKHALAALVATAALTLTGCSSTEPGVPPTAAPDQNDSSSAEPTAEPEETAASAPRIEREKVDKTPSVQVILGSTRYDVNTSDNIDGALGNLLTDKANAFLREHYLRRDRWAGKWYFKEGELDAYREKVTSELFADVEKVLTLTEADYAKHGMQSEKWPKKVLKAAEKRSTGYARLFFNSGTGEGSGDIVYRGTERSLFRGSTEFGWEGVQVGAPITFATFEAAHKVGSDGPTTVQMWQAWKKVKGDWLIVDAGWNYPSS